MTKHGLESVHDRLDKTEGVLLQAVKIGEDTNARLALQNIKQESQHDEISETVTEHEKRINKLEDFAIGKAAFI